MRSVCCVSPAAATSTRLPNSDARADCRADQRQQQKQRQRHRRKFREYSRARRSGRRAATAVFQTMLQRAQRAIGAQRQQRGGNRARQSRRVIEVAKPVVNQNAEAAGGDERRNRRDADAQHGRGANARQNERRRQRKFDLSQNLALGHAHRDGGFAHIFIDALHAGQRVANQRQNRINHQRDDGVLRADIEKRQQKPEQRQTWNRLKNVRAADDWFLQRRSPRRQHAQRHADDERNRHRDHDQREMLAGAF